MRHEQLRKDAARKRAGEEYRKKEDVRNKKEVEERFKQSMAEQSEPTLEPKPISKKLVSSNIKKQCYLLLQDGRGL